jgi:hypothetical protein
MCIEHKYLWWEEWESLVSCSTENTTIASNVTQIENKVVAELPEWATNEQIEGFMSKVKDSFLSIFS